MLADPTDQLVLQLLESIGLAPCRSVISDTTLAGASFIRLRTDSAQVVGTGLAKESSTRLCLLAAASPAREQGGTGRPDIRRSQLGSAGDRRSAGGRPDVVAGEDPLEGETGHGLQMAGDLAVEGIWIASAPRQPGR
jgi:hypothetical protein